MKRLLFVGLLLCLLCAPVLAWSNSLNNNNIPLYNYGVGTVTYPSYTPYADTISAYVVCSDSGQRMYVVFPNYSSTSTYFAYDNVGLSRGAIVLQSSTGSYLADIDFQQSTQGRVESVRTSPTTLLTYVDGVQIRSDSIAATDAVAFGGGTANGPGNVYIDDPTFGNAIGDTGIVSTMPHNWYILKDFLNPNSYGQIDNYGNKISTTQFHVKWSIGAQADGWNITAPPQTRYTIRITAPSGNASYNQYVDIATAGHAYGYVTIPFNNTYIGSAPLEYGTYFVTLYDGTFVKSQDTFQVLSTGATIYWNQANYIASDTALLTYAVDGSYWIPATYDYSIKVVNVYGVQQGSYPVTSASGTQSIPLTDYTPGVYYAELIATEKAVPTNIAVLGISSMEMTAYIKFNGYVMNAETGNTISGAVVNISQTTTHHATTTDASGWYYNDNGWLTGLATTIYTTASGYTADTQTFTPAVALNASINISLMPSTPASTGSSIGGIITDSTYHNPIANATATVRNTSTLESFTNRSNIAGYYRVDNLVSGRPYDVWSSKSGWGNSTVHVVTAV